MTFSILSPNEKAAPYPFTKSDKLKKQACRNSFDSVESIVGEVSSIQLFSSLKRSGADEARERLLELLSS